VTGRTNTIDEIKGANQSKLPGWIKVSAAYLEDHPLPLSDLLADRIQLREKVKREALAAKKQTRRDRRPQVHSSPSICPKSALKLGTAGRASLSSTDVPARSRRLSPSERIESSDRKMIPSVTEQANMKADKGQFDEVLRRMIEKNPKKTADIKQTNLGFRRKKNPETDPQKIAEFGLDDAPTGTEKKKN